MTTAVIQPDLPRRSRGPNYRNGSSDGGGSRDSSSDVSSSKSGLIELTLVTSEGDDNVKCISSTIHSTDDLTDEIHPEEQLISNVPSSSEDCESQGVTSKRLDELLAIRARLRRKNVYLLKKLMQHCEMKQVSLCQRHYIIETERKAEKITGVKMNDERVSPDTLESYRRKLKQDHATKKKIEADEKYLRESLAVQKNRSLETKRMADKAYSDLVELEISVGRKSLTRKTNRSFTVKTIERFVSEQTFKMAELSEARLRYIKLKNEVLKIKQDLVGMEELERGLCLRDYKQLEHENSTLNSKVDHVKSKLAKLHSRAHLYNQLSTRMKAKALKIECAVENARLIYSQVEEELLKEEEKLGSLRSERPSCEKLRGQDETDRTRNKVFECPGETRPLLVKDYEVKKQRLKEQQAELRSLKISCARIDRRVQETQRWAKHLSRRCQQPQKHMDKLPVPPVIV